MTNAVTPHPQSSPATVSEVARELAQTKVELTSAQDALKACQESHERNLSALCAIADGIAIVDTMGCVTCLNPVAAHLTGWREDDCLGRELTNVVQFADHQGRPVDILADGFSSDLDSIVSLVRRDGHVILVDGSVSPVHGRDKRKLGAVLTFRNVTASTRLARELAYHANHDVLTGLQNRRAFDTQLQRAIRHADEFGSGNALLYLDLDRFKAVNDAGGHVAGDELLRQLAVLLRRQLREHDTVARLGGDEFAVLLQNCTRADAINVAEKIRNALDDFTFAWNDLQQRIGTSIGLVDFNDGQRSTEQLMAIADSMCYAAKDGGRNRVAIFGTDDHPAQPDGLDVSHRPGARTYQDNAISMPPKKNGAEEINASSS